jgi:phospholipid/cholesterol/gamma-HCH transport system permease protein
MEVSELCGRREIKMDRAGQPDGLGRLLQLAEAVPEKKRRVKNRRDPVSRTRDQMPLSARALLSETLKFLGEMTITFLQLFRIAALGHNPERFSGNLTGFTGLL